MSAIGAGCNCSICQASRAAQIDPATERVVRHDDGRLAIEHFPRYVPSEEEVAAALRSLAKAHPYLVTHASHIDGEFDNALSEIRRILNALAPTFNDSFYGNPPTPTVRCACNASNCRKSILAVGYHCHRDEERSDAAPAPSGGTPTPKSCPCGKTPTISIEKGGGADAYCPDIQCTRGPTIVHGTEGTIVASWNAELARRQSPPVVPSGEAATTLAHEAAIRRVATEVLDENLTELALEDELAATRARVAELERHERSEVLPRNQVPDAPRLQDRWLLEPHPQRPLVCRSRLHSSGSASDDATGAVATRAGIPRQRADTAAR